MKNALSELLSEGDGSLSFVRLAGLLIIGTIAAEHIVVTIKTGTPPPWDWQQLSAIGGALAAKVVQKPWETPAPTPPAPPKP